MGEVGRCTFWILDLGYQLITILLQVRNAGAFGKSAAGRDDEEKAGSWQLDPHFVGKPTLGAVRKRCRSDLGAKEDG